MICCRNEIFLSFIFLKNYKWLQNFCSGSPKAFRLFGLSGLFGHLRRPTPKQTGNIGAGGRRAQSAKIIMGGIGMPIPPIKPKAYSK